jgi:uncharacterized protein YndB with AHSA1/START domain
MTAERFVYVTYIASTTEKIFRALIDGELTRQYWQRTNESDWRPGSRWKHVAADGSGTVQIVGTVVEMVPNRRLVLTWAASSEAADPGQHSRVAIDLEAIGSMVRVTVTHEELVPGSDMARKVSNGWPRVLSSLKSLLETGRALDTWAS